MKNKNMAILLVILCSILTAFGMVFWKIGADKLIFNWTILTNYALWLGFVLYGVGTLFLIFSLKFGNLSLVHPFLSLGFILASILAFFYLGESFSMLKISGITIVILGTFFIFKGDKQ